MFIENLCHTKGTWAGKPFELIDWQEQIIRDLFGMLKSNGYRQFNTAYIEIPKSKVNPNLPPLLRCSLPAAMERNEPRFTAAPLTDSRRLSYLMSQRIWCECVLRCQSV